MRAKKFTINDNDREEFVINEEGLYSWFRRAGRKGIRAFVRENREAIDAVIRKANEPPKRPF